MDLKKNKNRKRTARPVCVSAVIRARLLSEVTLEPIWIVSTGMENGHGHVKVALKVASVTEQIMSCAPSSGTRQFQIFH